MGWVGGISCRTVRWLADDPHKNDEQKQADREEATDPLGLPSITKGSAEEAILAS